MVDNISWRGSQPQCDGFKIIEYFAEGVIDRAMAFINDDEIEEVRRQVLHIIPDDVEHCRVGRDIYATVCSNQLFTHIWPARFIRQVLFESCQCLLTQSDAIHEK